MLKDNTIDTTAIRAVIGEYGGQQKSVVERSEIYRDLLGYVPSRIQARMAVTGAIDPEILEMQEQVRRHAMYPSCFDVKTAQLMLFGILLMGSNEAAVVHADAARQAGATYEELQATVNLVFLYRGLPAANSGAEILKIVAEKEHAEGEA
jgi:alkylhydroperoxidase/carboxymuconolactone decarboxylase family protein YurZ